MSDILEDIITLFSINDEGKHYDNLSRGYFMGSKTGKSISKYVIDINTNLYPMEVFCEYKFLISKSDECKGEYDYVMYGQVYKVNDQKTKPQDQTQFYISFGGLLMKATVLTFLERITLDDNLYLMIRKLQ